ncbi:electron transfer flavoprotein subunit beta/FixA family protein [Streptomyces sp. NPDC003442]
MTLKIIVPVKHVPDATGDRCFADDHTTDRAAVDGLLSELDEYAVEQALRLAESTDDAEVVALTVGPDDAVDALRRALAMGAQRAVHVSDEAVHGSDALATSAILAKAIEHAGYDLIVCGMASTDGVMGVIPALLAERLAVPQVTLLTELTLDGGTLTGRREADHATERLQAGLPALVSVTDQSGEARYPTFKGIMAARKKPVETLDLDDLGLNGDQLGLVGARTAVRTITAQPPRQAGTLIEDDGEGAERLAAFLAERKFL